MNLTKQITNNLLKHKFEKCKTCNGEGMYTHFDEAGLKITADCIFCLGTGIQLFVIEDGEVYEEQPKPKYCPSCKNEEIKDNGDCLYRCRKCDTEFVYELRYDPKTDKHFFEGKLEEQDRTYPILGEAKEEEKFYHCPKCGIVGIMHPREGVLKFKIFKLTEEKGVKKAFIGMV